MLTATANKEHLAAVPPLTPPRPHSRGRGLDVNFWSWTYRLTTTAYKEHLAAIDIPEGADVTLRVWWRMHTLTRELAVFSPGAR